MPKKKVSVIITDIDNTLFDWFEVWYKSFSPMIDSLVSTSGVQKDTLISEIKTIHEAHVTSEYLFLIQEIPSLKEKHKDEDLTYVYNNVIREYVKARSTHLRLYPRVLETLKTLKEFGCLIIGYTESQQFYTEFRVKELGLDGVLDYLYSPQGHEIPSLSPNQTALFQVKKRKLEHTKHRYTPKDEFKPNPQILRDIIADIEVPEDEVAYVGDSLSKDISMAQTVHVNDVHAKYGTSHGLAEYELLRKVTHWKEKDVEEEKTTEVVPTSVLQCSYSEILTLFNFIPYVGSSAMVPTSQIPHYLDIWKKTIDVQQHFNDLELRIRNLAVTVLGVILSGVAFSLKENLYVVLYNQSIPMAILLIVGGLVTWIAFYLMDRHWYHRLLIGAVRHGEAVEQRLVKTLPQIDLTNSISKASPTKIIGGKEIHSSEKLAWFYRIVIILLIIFGVIIYLGAPPKPKDSSSAITTGTDAKGANPQTLDPRSTTKSPEQSER